MKLKQEKCKLMQISFLREPPPVVRPVVHNCPMEVVTSFNLLGIIIQNDLKWNLQVERMVIRVSPFIHPVQTKKERCQNL